MEESGVPCRRETVNGTKASRHNYHPRPRIKSGVTGFAGVTMRPVKSRDRLPEVNFSDHGDVRYLHLGTEWVQGSMDLREPYALHLEYVQRMMAWLLFADPTTVSKRHAMQLGLGAA